MTLQSVEAHSGNELERAFEMMMRERPTALLMSGDFVLKVHIDWIHAFAARNRLPVMDQLKENVVRGRANGV